ncbi:peptidase S8/S53 domain-containing protein [Echria macrotheca]|uniref:Peptidase S8/S53 domain-containing protein n=1 Tax=Echria macrotheca TaxID=438768 RepID=A0AAJ0FC13_9PEZI|nr:peptidase S8/S53 domain-containing protein [Echria macrotheca]
MVFQPLLLLTLAAAILLSPLQASAEPTSHSLLPKPPIKPIRFGPSTPIPDHYIVQYHAHVSQPDRHRHEKATHFSATEVSRTSTSRGKKRYAGVKRRFSIGEFGGYHAELGQEQVDRLRKSPLVKSIHPDTRITLASPAFFQRDTQLPPGPPPPSPPPSQQEDQLSTIRTASAPNWGQARISHRSLSSSDAQYIYQDPAPTTVYIVDSGIDTSHWQFTSPFSSPDNKSRATFGASFVPDDNATTTDSLGHGTHVAGIIAGRTLGINPRAHVVSVKVFGADASGSWSAVLAALEYITNTTSQSRTATRSIINLSLGADHSQPINDAVAAAISSFNITIIAAAGNDARNVSQVTPASAEGVIAVGAIDATDTRCAFSNFGEGISVFAPGAGILSSVPGGGDGNNNATREMSGTSMAAPHVAGLAAYFIDVYGEHTPAQMRARIEGVATTGRVRDAGVGSPDRIAFNGNRAES